MNSSYPYASEGAVIGMDESIISTLRTASRIMRKLSENELASRSLRVMLDEETLAKLRPKYRYSSHSLYMNQGCPSVTRV